MWAPPGAYWETIVLRRLFGSRDKADPIATELYGVIVALARDPAIYRDLGVPDTVPGRFEMVLLHIAIVMDRLQRGSEAEGKLGQDLFDAFCRDMDETLREFGVGDTVMGKRMNGMAQSFYGRKQSYAEALGAGDRDGLTEALKRNIAPERDAAEASSVAFPALADHALAFHRAVETVPTGGFQDAGASLAERLETARDG